MKAGTAQSGRAILAVFAAIAMIMSLMAVYAMPADADHDNPVLIPGSDNDGKTCAEIEGSGQEWTEFRLEGSDLTNGEHTDGTLSVTLSNLTDTSFDWSSNIGVDAVIIKTGKAGGHLYHYDPPAESMGDTNLVSPPGEGNGVSHINFCYDVEQPQDQDPTVSVGQECRMDVSDGPVGDVTFDVNDPDEVIESISIDGPGTFAAEVDSSAGWAIELLPGDYSWSANFVESYAGDPIGGDLTVQDDCLTCPIPGAIDLSNSGQLGSYHSPFFDTWGGPVEDVNIPAGFYNITLASYDSHSEKSGQSQTLELWALANGPNGGTWQSPFTPDLADNVNFAIYENVGGGPVLLPEIQDLYTVHGYLGTDMSANSVQPVCAQFTPVTQEVDVQVSWDSCVVDAEAPLNGEFSVEIDPESQAKVSVYDSEDNLVDEIDGAGGSINLAPGEYRWETEAETGYTATGDTEGTFTIEPCDVLVGVSANACTIDDQGQPAGSVDVTIDPNSGAEVNIYSDAAMTDLVTTVSASGSVDLAPGTYHWEAQSADGFAVSGTSSGQFTIEDCETTVTVTGFCDEGAAFISVTIPDAGSATVDIPGVGVFTESGTQIVEDDQTYSWSATAASGFSLTETSGEVEIESCSEVMASILVTVDSSCEVVDGVGVGTIDVGVGVDDGATVVISDDDGAIGTFTSDGSLTVEPGTYTWEATPSEGFEFPPGFESSGTIVIEDCTPDDEVMAAIQVTVDGFCEVDDNDEGVGFVDVNISVDDGATVVVRDADGDVVGTLTSDGTIEVPEGATYTWEATPSEGFEFPEGAASSGSITIETCSDPETLPFTGMDMDLMAALAAVLVGTGFLTVFSVRRREES